ncbi:ribosome maturation factor RimP [bacterium]|nr:ribosome maturation factor RimP [bacterium]
MGIRATIEEIIREELTDSEHFIVSIKSNETETDIKFYIDGYNGVGIATCAKLSRAVSRELDERGIDPDNLKYEISSPGADKPLTDLRQYHQHIGRDLEVTLKNDTKVDGELAEVKEDEIVLKVAKDKKKKNIENKTLRFEQIKQSVVRISFKKVKK